MEKTNPIDLPQIAVDYLDSVIKAMKYRKKVRAEVREELIAHFTDALANCETDDEKREAAKELITEFGDIKLLGKLLRRAKKRCRPLWKKAVVFSFKLVGILFLLLLLRVGYMATGRPTISVDYTQWMNDKVCDGRDESLNAYHDYQKAIKLISKDYPPEIRKILDYTREQQKTPEDWIAIEAFLEIHAEALNAFRAGAAKPYCWNTYQFSKSEKEQIASGVIENLMPQLGPVKKLARRVGYFQIPLTIHQGNTKQAVDDSIALYIYGQHIISQGVAIEQLGGIAIEGLAMQVIYDLLNQVDLPASDLHRLQQIVEKDYNPDKAIMDWSLEKAFWYDQIQRSFTDDGHGNGRPLPSGTILVANDPGDFAKGLLAGFPDRRETTLQIENRFKSFDHYRNLTPYTLHSNEESGISVSEVFFLEKNTTIPAIAMQNVTAPAMIKTVKMSWRVRTAEAGLIGTLAILRFEKENGRLPGDWDELHERGYLKIIPMDPYSEQPLMYRKTDDGFILYSIGSNFTDDGGVPGIDNKGRRRPYLENGDWVVWPVE